MTEGSKKKKVGGRNRSTHWSITMADLSLLSWCTRFSTLHKWNEKIFVITLLHTFYIKMYSTDTANYQKALKITVPRIISWLRKCVFSLTTRIYKKKKNLETPTVLWVRANGLWFPRCRPDKKLRQRFRSRTTRSTKLSTTNILRDVNRILINHLIILKTRWKFS